jgi:hypothetical protein
MGKSKLDVSRVHINTVWPHGPSTDQRQQHPRIEGVDLRTHASALVEDRARLRMSTLPTFD